MSPRRLLGCWIVSRKWESGLNITLAHSQTSTQLNLLPRCWWCPLNWWRPLKGRNLESVKETKCERRSSWMMCAANCLQLSGISSASSGGRRIDRWICGSGLSSTLPRTPNRLGWFELNGDLWLILVSETSWTPKTARNQEEKEYQWGYIGQFWHECTCRGGYWERSWGWGGRKGKKGQEDPWN